MHTYFIEVHPESSSHSSAIQEGAKNPFIHVSPARLLAKAPLENTIAVADGSASNHKAVVRLSPALSELNSALKCNYIMLCIF